MKKIGLALILGLIFSAFTSPGEAVNEEAAKSGVVSTLGVGARAPGMGGAYVALADDASATYWNPAGLVQIKDRQICSMHSQLDLERDYDFLNIVSSLPAGDTWGISWARLGIDDILCFDGSGNPTGTTSYKEEAYFLSYGKSLSPNLSLGGNIKYYRQTLYTASAKGIGLDLGLLYKFPNLPIALDELSVGLLLQDLTETKIKWKNTAENPTEKIPINIKLGVAGKLLEEKLVVALDYDKRTNLHAGCEYWLIDILGVRAGIDDGNFTCGASFKLQTYQIDYAYVKEDLADGQRISVTAHF